MPRRHLASEGLKAFLCKDSMQLRFSFSFASRPRSSIESDSLAPLRGALQCLMDEGGLYAVFQPPVDIRNGTVYGHEALIRGPVDGPLHRRAVQMRGHRIDPTDRFNGACCKPIVIVQHPRHTRSMTWVSLETTRTVTSAQIDTQRSSGP